jgi:hypothetical protein
MRAPDSTIRHVVGGMSWERCAGYVNESLASLIVVDIASRQYHAASTPSEARAGFLRFA